MLVKLVRTVSKADGCLKVEESDESFADAYLSKGWTVLGLFRGDAPNEVLFVLRRDDVVAAAAEMLEEAAVIDTSALHDLS